MRRQQPFNYLWSGIICTVGGLVFLMSAAMEPGQTVRKTGHSGEGLPLEEFSWFLVAGGVLMTIVGIANHQRKPKRIDGF
ncbi:MAG: hypothetical protein AAF456_20005 [Planctomycetota bacterium]